MNLLRTMGRRRRGRDRNRTARPRVELCEDRILLTQQFLVTTTAPTGEGSLAQAIDDANTSGQSSIIDFDIPGGGPFVITLTGALDPIGVPTLLDGTSQPGYAGTPLIQIDGQTDAIPGDAFDLASGSDGSRIRGLDIYGFSSGAAVDIQSPDDTVQSDELGTDVDGTSAPAGNLEGVVVDGVSGSTIGGTTSVGNLISGNSTGILIEGSAAGTLVEGNLIGTDAAGTSALGNTAAGIEVTGSSGNTIGSTTSGTGNVIAYNPVAVGITDGTGNSVRGNSIFANDQAITLNDANDDLPPPSLSYATTYSGTTVVQGALGSGFAAGTSYEVDFYASAAGDDLSTPGQAQIYLGSEEVTTGDSPFTFTADVTVPVGQVITATATDPSGNTSQFAASPNFTDTTAATVVNAFVVTTDGDQPGSATGLTSLPQAIANADADTSNSNADTISFAIGTGPATITLTSGALPALTHPVILDGTTQPGYSGTPLIAIDGDGLSGAGLVLQATGSTIKGLDIVDFGGAGIDVDASGDVVQANVLGANPAGTAAGPGNQVGILIDGSDNTIGGTASLAGNIVAFNAGAAVDVASGSSNAIRGNLIYGDGSAIETTSPVSPPTLTGAVSSGGTTTIEGGFGSAQPGGTILDFYASSGSLSPAAIYLGSYTLPASSSTFTAILPVPVATGASIVATTTSSPSSSPPNDTSTLSSPLTVGNPFVVTTTADNGDDANPIVGSLRQVILSVDSNPQGPNTITFAIPGGTGPFIIELAAALPAITSPVTIDGATESAFLGSASPIVVEIDGQGDVDDGLTLASGSGAGTAGNGSAIEGLTITGFTQAGILVQTNNNTIGGTAAWAGDVIANNAGAAVDLAAGTTGDVVRQNLIHGNGSAIVSPSGSPAPEVLAVASVPDLTTIDYTVSGSQGASYAIDFFASNADGGPAGQFLGSSTVTLSSSTQNGSITLALTTPLGTSQTVSATATETSPPSGITTTTDTSPFATATANPTSEPFAVTNTSDDVPGSEVGSLRQAILNANASPPAAGATDPISFALTGSAPYVIDIVQGTPLPPIMVPVSIEGTAGAPTVVLDGGGQAFAGLELAPGAAGSVVQGLDIVDFDGAGIEIEADDVSIAGNFLGTDPAGTAAGPGNVVGILVNGADGVTIGGTTAGGSSTAANLIGFNTSAGISILSGTGNAVHADTYVGTNGSLTSPSVAANDIGVSLGANGNVQPPQVVSASLAPGGGSLSVALSGVVGSDTLLDVYEYTAGERTFLGETTVAAGSFFGSLSVSGVGAGSQIVATQTIGTDGTSAFSTPVTVAPESVVTNTNSSGPGSLADAISLADEGGGADIIFQIPGPANGPFTIPVTSTLAIDVRVTINGTTELTGEGTPAVVLGASGGAATGLDLEAGSGGSLIEGLAFSGFTGAAILVASAGNTLGGTATGAGNIVGGSSVGVSITGSSNVLLGNFIGTDGVGDDLHDATGILIDAPGSDNTIGGTAAGDGNTIGFNTTAGVSITGETATGNVMVGDDVGTNADANDLANAEGVVLDDDPGNTIGGSTLGSANIIGFNAGAGILIAGSSDDLVWGNDIGTDPSNSKMGNGVGVEIDGSSDNSIGATVSGALDFTPAVPAWFTQSLTYAVSESTITGAALSGIGNLIDFNLDAGVSITGIASSGDGPGSTSTGNVLVGNLIGVNLSSPDDSGAEFLNAGNLGDGIDLDGTDGVVANSIGYAQTLSYTPTVTGTIVPALTLTDAIGSAPLQTYPAQTALPGTVISGIVAVGNMIAASKGIGVNLDDSAAQNVLVGNTIGATSSTLGGAANSLAGNSGDGVAITDSFGNTIGSAALAATTTIANLNGAADVVSGNAGDGIAVTAGSQTGMGNVIAGNLVSFNTQNGIHFVGNLTQDGYQPSGQFSLVTPQVLIVNNLVGTTFDGSSTVDANGITQGNGLDGIRLDQSGSSVAGDLADVPSATVAYNVSSGNSLDGINVETENGAMAYVEVSIIGDHLGTDISGVVGGAKSGGVVVPFGNALAGILLAEVTGVTVGGTATGAADVLSGNKQGIDVTQDTLDFGANPGALGLPATLDDVIEGNLIGVGSGGTDVADANGTSLGNLSDGIFLMDPGRQVGDLQTGVVIEGNTISNNDGSGIHAEVGPGIAIGTDGLTISGNRIGTDQTGTVVAGLGNGSEGIFLDGFPEAAGPGALVTVEGNVISGNDDDGIDLLKSYQVLILGNEIGTDLDRSSTLGDPAGDFGNANNGVFINQSDRITIGGTAQGDINIISGNHASGIFVSGATATQADGTAIEDESDDNLIEGNWIGVGENAAGQTTALPNAVVGIILSNAGSNTIGGVAPGSGNVVSGNALDGILLVDDASDNSIQGNLIGTDPTASAALGNSVDGVFLLGSSAITISGVTPNSTPSTISGNTIASNVIAGNNEDGIQVFGAGATDNTFALNLIGLAPGGAPIGNGADGVLLNDAGPSNLVGGSGQGNVISDNAQAGVEITGSPDATTGTLVQGNLIGTDPSGTSADGNGSYGVLVYGSSSNTIGGATGSPGTGAGNVISANSQAGVQIFNPGGTLAGYNLVLGNLIGTDAAGTAGLGNGSDGVEVENASDNTIGGASAADRNVISGNAGNGVLIVQFPGLAATGDQVLGNEIGTNAAGSAGIGNSGNGVELNDGSANVVGGISGGATLADTEVPSGGGPGGSPGNLISGNGQWGVLMELTGASAGQPQSLIEGNVIGLDATETFAIGNRQGGILVDNVATQPLGQTIGGPAAGAGNLISGNASVGIDLAGPQAGGSGTSDVVQGNLIGLNAAGQIVANAGGTGNGTGILVDDSPDDLIGGASPADRNIISGNSRSGVELFNDLSTGDMVLGNFIGTDLAGMSFPGDSNEAAPPQGVGVLISGASSDTIGQDASGAGNVISGDAVGVQISGQQLNSGQSVGSGNAVAGNLIGTDASGTRPVANLDLGVYITDSPGNVIGPGNVVSANGIAGIEIVSDGSQHNLVTDNIVGSGIGGQIFSSQGQPVLSSNGAEPGIPVYAEAQLNGVVVLGGSNNTIGVDRRIAGSASNTIVGNVEVGVYITSRDFNGVVYSMPTGNAVSGNMIRSNGIYGVLLYNAPNNPVRPFTSPSRFLVKNRFGAQEISFRDYQGSFDGGTPLPTRGKRPGARARATTVRVRRKADDVKTVIKAAHPAATSAVLHGARRRVPVHSEPRARRS